MPYSEQIFRAEEPSIHTKVDEWGKVVISIGDAAGTALDAEGVGQLKRMLDKALEVALGEKDTD